MNNSDVHDPLVQLRVQKTLEALQRLDKFETQEWREAMDVVPGLVERETPIHYFLRLFDPHQAARRIAKNWKYRKVLFEERWLLPMTQTGTGALDKMTIEFVRTGYAFVIPRRNTGPLVVVDFSKALEVFDRARAVGYDTHRIVESMLFYAAIACIEEFTKGPTTYMLPVRTKRRPELEVRPQYWDLFKTAFPGYVENVVVVQSYEEGKEALLDYLRYQSARIVQVGAQIVPQEIHANSMGQTLKLLEDAGISRSIVPTELGGLYQSDAKVAEWIRARIGIESFWAPVPAALSMPQNGMQLIRTTEGNRRKKTPLLKRKAHEGQTEKAFRRERNRIYGRRHIQKMNLNLLPLIDQRRYLEQRNQALLSQNQLLERALQAAKDLVARHGQETHLHAQEHRLTASLSYPAF